MSVILMEAIERIDNEDTSENWMKNVGSDVD